MQEIHQNVNVISYGTVSKLEGKTISEGKGHADRGKSLVIVTITLISVATITVVLRLIARFWILRASGADDWCVIGAVLTSIGMLVSICLGVRHGIGEHETSENVDTVTLGKIQLGTQAVYIMSSGLIKLSILFLYRRIFPSLQKVIIVSIVFVALLTVAFVFTAIFQCKPIGSFWVRPHDNQDSCISLLIFWCDVAVIFLISNIWIMGLPLKSIIGLQLRMKRKVMTLGLLCSTGICTVVAAAVRLAYVIHLYKERDSSWDVVPIYLCSVVEISTALVASSIPALRLAGSKYSEHLGSCSGDSKNQAPYPGMSLGVSESV